MKTCYKIYLHATLLAFVFVLSVAFNAHATKHTITVQNYFFAPISLTINLGDTVEWKWIGGNHTTTSVTIPAGAAAWDSPIKSTLQTFNYVPTVLGSYNYKCTPHLVNKNMQANFTVVCPSASVSISAGGPTTFCKGGAVTLSQSSAGTFSSYQWQLDGADIAGASASGYDADATGSYTLEVVGNCGSSAISNAIAVTVNKKPKANVTPEGPINMCAGETVLLSVSTAANQTYQWKKGNTNISGATNPMYLVTEAGDYKCKVTKTTTGCTKTSNAVTVMITCKADGQLMEATAYPNPSTDYFVIKTSSVSVENVLVRIYDLTGKLLETHVGGIETLEAGKNLPQGVYFAKIEVAGNVEQVLKLIKN